ncbi:peptidoglycan-binding domain-containing protein [uncultured Cohaesibacter sp.]|uniref:peptidoglycan-binding domain-containing protein n=1 Tax=uncultured Cohaesibacter sp. TaxID=1002546 RepID=UPI0029C6C815|nr:peptidoglycan-binding domain-containing protein [uncultured Cohaesibacter sp.]
MSETYDDYENWEEERKVSPLTLVGILVMTLTSASIIGNALWRQPKSAEIEMMNSVRNDHLKLQNGTARDGLSAVQANRIAMTLTIQNALTIAGYYAGPIDGLEGNQTKEAISAYQDYIGLPVTGNVSQELYDILTRRKDLPTGSVASVHSVRVSPSIQNVMPGEILQATPQPQPEQSAGAMEQAQTQAELDTLPRIKPATRPAPVSLTPRKSERLAVAPMPASSNVDLSGPVPPESIPTATTLANAAGDPVLAKVQRALKNIGYQNLSVDGVMGRQTSSAIASFQRSRGHPVTGQVNDRLLQEMMVMGYLDLG